jgi:hypothetical protein
MTPEKFNYVVDKVVDRCKEILCDREKQYSDEDRISNFKKAAQVRGLSPEEILMGFKVKHEVALGDYVKKLSSGEQVPVEWIVEKITDIINYHILLYALILDRKVNE